MVYGTRWFVKYLSHVIIYWKAWPEFGNDDISGQLTQDSKEKVIAIVLEKTGMWVEQAQLGGHGGTFTDGNIGRIFLSSEIFPIFEELLPKKTETQRKTKENVIKLHIQISSVLRINSSASKIDTKKNSSLYVKKPAWI